jgi:hypothetical protein
LACPRGRSCAASGKFREAINGFRPQRGGIAGDGGFTSPFDARHSPV